MSFTSHAEERCAERNVSEDDVRYVIEHGRWEQAAGSRMYFLGRRDIPGPDRAKTRIQQLEGLCVHTERVSEHEIRITTVYHNEDSGLKDHRRKSKYNRRGGRAA